jgi:hypothetical protein
MTEAELKQQAQEIFSRNYYDQTKFEFTSQIADDDPFMAIWTDIVSTYHHTVSLSLDKFGNILSYDDE